MLLGCDRMQLPDYWLCQGESIQTVVSVNGDIQESYRGKEPLMLEVWNGGVYQFLQPSLSGKYYRCSVPTGSKENPDNLYFQMPNCQSSKPETFSRNGVLNLSTGALRLDERRRVGDQTIFNGATYNCRNLGHTFSFADFNYEKP